MRRTGRHCSGRWRLAVAGCNCGSLPDRLRSGPDGARTGPWPSASERRRSRASRAADRVKGESDQQSNREAASDSCPAGHLAHARWQFRHPYPSAFRRQGSPGLSSYANTDAGAARGFGEKLVGRACPCDETAGGRGRRSRGFQLQLVSPIDLALSQAARPSSAGLAVHPALRACHAPVLSGRRR